MFLYENCSGNLRLQRHKAKKHEGIMPLSIMTLTQAAADRIRQIGASQGESFVGLRLGVKNGGCAGMSYTIESASDIRLGEEIIREHGVTVLIDPKAILFLIGARMDFVTTRLSSQFVFENPNQTGACGCGESVALTPAVAL
jgi:iron-sulfur cluster assembly protein